MTHTSSANANRFISPPDIPLVMPGLPVKIQHKTKSYSFRFLQVEAFDQLGVRIKRIHYRYIVLVSRKA